MHSLKNINISKFMASGPTQLQYNDISFISPSQKYNNIYFFSRNRLQHSTYISVPQIHIFHAQKMSSWGFMLLVMVNLDLMYCLRSSTFLMLANKPASRVAWVFFFSAILFFSFSDNCCPSWAKKASSLFLAALTAVLAK